MDALVRYSLNGISTYVSTGAFAGMEGILLSISV